MAAVQTRMMSIQLGLQDLAKYPFLGEAGEYVRDLDLDIEELGQPDYQNAVQRARQRILEAARKGRPVEIEKPEVEILSFPIALILVKASGLEHLASRFSYSEAIRSEELLKEEANTALVAYIFRSALNIDLIEVTKEIGGQEFKFKIRVTEYLKRATQFHSVEWKLINRIVEKGYVYLRTPDLIRLIREQIRMMIYSRIKAAAVPRLPQPLQQAVEEITKASPTPKAYREEFAPSEYPPCVLHALDLTQKGQNVPHFGRFLLTTYLLAAGKTVDDLLHLFSKSPDFNERIARYQVEHIAGLRGGRTKYRTPSCRTLQTHSFCFKTEACDEIKNPMQFGRRPAKEGKGKKAWIKRRRTS